MLRDILEVIQDIWNDAFGKAIAITCMVGIVLIIVLGVLASQHSTNTMMLRKTCADNGYPTFREIGGEYYCQRLVDGTDEIVPVTIFIGD